MKKEKKELIKKVQKELKSIIDFKKSKVKKYSDRKRGNFFVIGSFTDNFSLDDPRSKIRSLDIKSLINKKYFVEFTTTGLVYFRKSKV